MAEPEVVRPAVVLGIDTASLVTVGLAVAGAYVGGAVVEDRMAHVEQLMPTVTRVLDEAGLRARDLTGIVVGLGPGPFTGLRVGVVTAQILSTITGARLHGICSLDPIAAQYVAEHEPTHDFLVATDARRRELYWARYAPNGSRTAGPDVSRPAELPAIPTVGPGTDVHDLPQAVTGPRRLDPRSLVLTGPDLPDAGTTPLYLRRPDAVEPIRRKSVMVRPDRRSRTR